MHESDSVTIQAADPSNHECLTALAVSAKASWGYPQAFMQQCHEELRVTSEDIRQSNTLYRVACYQQQIVGYTALITDAMKTAELDALYVSPAYQRLGIGRLLLRDAVRLAESLDITRLLVQSDPNAAPFYRALGAELIGERESDSIPGRYLPLFEIRIPASHHTT